MCPASLAESRMVARRKAGYRKDAITAKVYLTFWRQRLILD
jgi:hypothetical protein